MSINDNGFTVNPIPYTSDIGYISQGAVIGISFGWIVGIIALYVLGMLFIRYYFRKYGNRSSSSSSLPKYRKPSSSSDQPMPNQPAKSQRQQQSNYGTGGRKRKQYEQNPTIQLMLNPTVQNETYKKINQEVHRRKNFNLEEKVQSDQQ